MENTLVSEIEQAEKKALEKEKTAKEMGETIILQASEKAVKIIGAALDKEKKSQADAILSLKKQHETEMEKVRKESELDAMEMRKRAKEKESKAIDIVLQEIV